MTLLQNHQEQSKWNSHVSYEQSEKIKYRQGCLHPMPIIFNFSFGDSRARGNAKHFRVYAASSFILIYVATARARETMSRVRARRCLSFGLRAC